MIESIYFFDENFKSTMDWYDAEIFVSWKDLESDSTDWVLFGFNAADTIIGNDYRDIIKGGNAGDILRGRNGNDKVYGEADDDKLYGDRDNDRLYGGSGDDLLFGGLGEDRLARGSGGDVFAFRTIEEVGKGDSCDRILGFNPRRDWIDLSRIDADTGARRDQDFELIGTNRYSDEAGELRFRNGILSGDVDGDGRSDFTLAVDGVAELRDVDIFL